MLASDFQRNLRKLNPNLRICCGDDDTKLAGIYHVVAGEYKDIIGIDKSFIPEWPQIDEKGKIVKSGWRRVMKHLIVRQLVDRKRAEAVFGSQIIGTRAPTYKSTYQDPIQKQIDEAYMRGVATTGKPAMKKDDIMDLAKVIEKQNEN